MHKGLEEKLFKACLNHLGKKGVVVLEEGVVREAGHKVMLKADEKDLREELNSFLDSAGLKAPTVKEIYAYFPDTDQAMVREALDLLLQDGIVSRVGGDLYFYSDYLEKLEGEMVSYLKKEGDIDAPRFKELTGLTRKFSIPLLEYFDWVKLTLRVGDKRVLRKKE